MTVEIVALVRLCLVSKEDVEVMVSESRSPGEELVGVQGRVTCVVLLASSVDILRVTTVRCRIVVALCVEHIVGGVNREDKILEDVHIDVAS